MTLLRTPETVTPVTATAPPTRRRTADPPRRFRPDIEGLRAVAVVSVVVYHAGLGLPGGYVGVDVFFVISGFLITRQLVGGVERDGARALPAFYAHRVRRLLPAAAVVVVATVVATRLVAPPLKVASIATDALFTTFYGLNYRLAVIGTDYQHMGAEASPLQHFWSLAVEEQFYLLWPAIVVVLVWAGRRRAGALLVVFVLAVVAVSGYLSAEITTSSAPWAYFSLQTRAWELGLGALVALTAASLARVPRAVAGTTAWLGLAAIVWSALTYTDSTPFPGTAAWLPVAGTAAVIAAGCGPRVGVERLLGEPLMQCLGKVSYSWYLWHWPLLVLVPYAVGHPLPALGRLAVVWVSLVLALLSYLLVEQPARSWSLPSWRWVGVGAVASVGIAGVCLAVIVNPPSLTGQGRDATVAASSAASRTVPAAMSAAIEAGTTAAAVPRNLEPGLDVAADSLPPTRDSGCHAEFTQVAQGDCVFGDTSADRTVVLFGDSHMEQWLPAFVAAAQRDRWKVVSWTKSACPVADLTVRNSSLNRDYTECDTWRDRTVRRIRALDPDLVVVSQSETVVPSDVSPETFAAATERTVGAIAAGVDAPVRYLHDNPIPGKDAPECLAGHLDDASACAYDADHAYSLPDRHAAIAPALRDDGVRTLDTQPWFCATDRCPEVVGNLLVYRDDSHMTVPYSRWLTPFARSILSDSGAAREGADRPARKG